MTSRIHRGFHRVGVVLAVALLLFALVVFFTSSEPSLAIFPAVAAVLVYAAARAVGWVLDGFLGPGRP